MFLRLFKKLMKDQEDFRSGLYVSVWIGEHRTETELDDYLSSGRFSQEWRFRLSETDLPEICAEPSRKSVAELVCGFSCCEQFQEDLLAAAKAQGIDGGHSMVVFHFLAYTPQGLPVASRPEMRFLGNFWFEGFK
jgi:hypothetical protein